MYDDDIKRRIIVEPSTKIERNPKFKVGEIVYRVNGNDTEEFLVVAVGINIEELMKNERVEFWYSIIAKPIEESPAVRGLRKLQEVLYSLLTHEIRVREEDLKEEHVIKPLDLILVKSNCWELCQYAFVKDGWVHTVGGLAFSEWIPYEGNEHLLGTTIVPKE